MTSRASLPRAARGKVADGVGGFVDASIAAALERAVIMACDDDEGGGGNGGSGSAARSYV